MKRGEIWWVNFEPAEVMVNGKKNKAMADQLTTVSKLLGL